MDLDWSFQMKGPVPMLTRQSLIPGGSVEINHGNLFGDSQVGGLASLGLYTYGQHSPPVIRWGG